MTCRVGITTDPVERMHYWKSQYSTFRNWRLISQHSSRSEAQMKEDLIAGNWGYEAYRGGSGPEYAVWYVYVFDHDEV